MDIIYGLTFSEAVAGSEREMGGLISHIFAE
jgi:hypothetical protein